MKNIREKIHNLGDNLATKLGQPVAIMEVCGTHTMAIARSGMRAMLPRTLRLISGPGCPVCVTDQSYIDRAVLLAKSKQAVIATYGDMIRVPGRRGSLAEARGEGADVQVVYSADQAVSLAAQNSGKQVVFLAVGFETTTPGTALAIQRAIDNRISNFTVLTAHKLILPAMEALLSAGDVQVDGFLCPGHVSVIIGWRAYEQIAERYRSPCVVTGFDAGQIFAGIAEILNQLSEDTPRSCTIYPAVSPEGNQEAIRLLDKFFVPADAPWRALGVIPLSGLVLRQKYAEFDAAMRFELPECESYELPGCRCGDVISGRCAPAECSLFASRCTLRDPVGPCMVSSEGACAAAYKYELRPAVR